MLILSRRQKDRLDVGENIVVDVLEIEPQRVQLGIIPPLGKPIDVNEVSAEGGTSNDPIIKLSADARMFVVTKAVGRNVLINKTIRIDVVEIVEDTVRLGLRAIRSEPATVTPDMLKAWVTRKLNDYLQGRERGALQELAKRLGVSTVTINRWRRGESNVAQENLVPLLEALNVTLDHLARDLDVSQVILPDIKKRGPNTQRTNRENPSPRYQEATSQTSEEA